MPTDKQYAQRDIVQLDEDGDYYIRHVSAMTAEGLHAKSDIAAELGWRDREIARLIDERFALYAAIQQAQKFGVGALLSPMCNCMTKTPDPAFHKPTCPVSYITKIARAALESGDE